MTEEKTAYGEGLFTTKEKKRGKKKMYAHRRKGALSAEETRRWLLKTKSTRSNKSSNYRLHQFIKAVFKII